MPIVVMHASEPPDQLYAKNAAARGLSLEDTPQAVQLALGALHTNLAGPFFNLLKELPAEARGFEYMAAAFAAYAEFADHTVVIAAEARPGATGAGT